MSQTVETETATTLSEHFTHEITREDAIERSMEYGDAGEVFASVLQDYILLEGLLDPSVFEVLARLGGAATNASLDRDLYALIYECMKSGICPRLDRPRLCIESEYQWNLHGPRCDFDLVKAFSFELDPKDYSYWCNSNGEFGTTRFSEVEEDHHRWSEMD